MRGQMLPVYPLTEGLAPVAVAQDRAQVVDDLADESDGSVAGSRFWPSHELWPIGRALARDPHAPGQRRMSSSARRRFVYQELLVLQLALALRRWNLQRTRRAPALPATAKIDARIRRLFPFELTADQQRTIQRDRRRHGTEHAHEPAAAGRSGQRQDGGGRVRHAAGRGAQVTRPC